MKKKDLIEQLVSEIETGRIRTLGIYGHGASGKSKKKCSDSLTIGVAPDTAERGLIRSIGL